MITALKSNTRLVSRIAISIFFFISGFGYSTWASRIPNIQKELNLNDAQLGAMLFGLPAGLMAMLPLTGILLSRFSSRNMMLTGGIFFNLMMTMLAFVTHSWQLFMVLFCFGASRNLFNISTNAQSMAVQGLFDRSIIASFHGIWSIAGFSGAAFGALMVSFNISPIYHFMSVSFVLTAMMLVFIPYSIPQKPAPEQRSSKFQLPSKGMLKFGMICFASMACEGTMYDWGAIYFEKVVHAGRETVTLGFTLYMIAMTAGRFSGDRVSGKLGVRRLLQLSGMLIFSGLILAALWPSFIPACIGFVLAGFGVSCVVPMVFAMATRSSGMTSGSAIASVSTIGYLGFLLVPPLVGFVAHSSSLQWSFSLIAIFGLLMTWLVSATGRETLDAVADK